MKNKISHTEEQNSILMLFEDGGIARVDQSIYAAPKGNTRPIDAYVVTQCEGDFTGSARRAAEAVYQLIQRQKALCENCVVGYDIQGITPGTKPVTGESGGLAFALSLAGAFLQKQVGPLAATGVIESSGGDAPITRVEGIAAKVEAAVNTLPENSDVFIPLENEKEISTELKRQLTDRGIRMHPVSTVAGALRIVFPNDFSNIRHHKPFASPRPVRMAILTIIALIIIGAISFYLFQGTGMFVAKNPPSSTITTHTATPKPMPPQADNMQSKPVRPEIAQPEKSRPVLQPVHPEKVIDSGFD